MAATTPTAAETASCGRAAGRRDCSRTRKLAALRTRGCSRELLLEPAAQRGRRRGPGLPRDDLALPNDHQRRDGLDSEAPLEAGRLIHVDLHQLDPAAQLLGELGQGRADYPARPATRRPEVDQ